MNFDKRKRSKEEARDLVHIPADEIRPYEVLTAPVYVYLKANQKFIALKGPLDFFDENSIKNILGKNNIFIGPFYEEAQEIKKYAKALREELMQPYVRYNDFNDRPFPDPQITLPTYARSRICLRKATEIWSSDRTIEPFVVMIYIDELCGLIPKSDLIRAYNRDVDQFELALLRSSWAVFLAMHLGYYDLDALTHLRLNAFNWTFDLPNNKVGFSETDRIIKTAMETVKVIDQKTIQDLMFKERDDELSRRLAARFDFRAVEYLGDDQNSWSIYGEKGFLVER